MNIPHKLYHYSSDPIEELKQNFHDRHRREFGLFQKPHGVWISIEDFGEEDSNWKSWCIAEGFNLEGLKYKYSISIREGARILYMSTIEELDAFSLKYAGNDPSEFKRYSAHIDQRPYIYIIDWQSVMSEYDGIMIAPYRWDCRLLNPTTAWYYGWDCSSGCIWNMQAIKSFTLDSITDMGELEVMAVEETQTDSLSASLGQLT